MNPTMIQFFHWYIPEGSFLWNHARDEAPYLAELGISSIWLPPMVKCQSGKRSNGYDPYDLFDLGEFDQKGTIPTKYGSREQLLEACAALRENTIGVIADIVLNHKAGGDELETFSAIKVDLEDRRKPISNNLDIKSYTKFTFPGRGLRYSSFIWDSRCFTGTDYAQDRHEQAIYRILNPWTDGWDEVIGDEKGNYDFLMLNDIEHRNPHVYEELITWGTWLHEQIGFSGVRLDAVKHISPHFTKNWVTDLRERTGKTLFAVGEFWAPGHLDLHLDYLEATDRSMSLFDSTLQHSFHVASQSSPYFDMRELIKDSLLLAAPDSAVTFVTNHDTQPLQQLEAVVEPWFKPLAYAIILLWARGYPCIFYPDLYGAIYSDTGHGQQETAVTLPKIAELESLIRLRQSHAHGDQHESFDSAHCIGFTRTGDNAHPGCAVVMSNAAADTKRMHIGTRYAGTIFRDALRNVPGQIVIEADGYAWFSCNHRSASVWIPAC